MEIPALTGNELEIMELLWREERPLSRSEIIELTPERSWSERSIHILLNSLLEKKAIEVGGFVRTNKNYGRTFVPLIDRADYIVSAVNQMKQSLSGTSKKSPVSAIFAALVQDKDIDDAELDELERMIAERRNRNKG